VRKAFESAAGIEKNLGAALKDLTRWRARWDSNPLSPVRTSDKRCATSVEIPDYTIKRELPLNKPIVVDLKLTKPDEIEFICATEDV
jgi:hypothetical protein